MEKTLIRPEEIQTEPMIRMLTKSGIPVVCRKCGDPLKKITYVRCSKCGSYLCPECASIHRC